jgi:hypothetical protein
MAPNPPTQASTPSNGLDRSCQRLHHSSIRKNPAPSEEKGNKKKFSNAKGRKRKPPETPPQETQPRHILLRPKKSCSIKRKQKKN